MKRVIQVVLMALVAVALIVPVGAGDTLKVGDFLTQIAQAKNLPATNGAAAYESLKSAGITLPNLDVNATLTEGTVTLIAAALGINVTTSNPTAVFSESQATAFVTTFASEIQTVGGDGVDQPASDIPYGLQKGYTWRKGQTKSRTEPL